MTACPKFGKSDVLREKLTCIFRENDIRAVEVLHMEVPCCTGLVRLARLALEEAGTDIPVRPTEIGLRGEILQGEDAPSAAEAAGK